MEKPPQLDYAPTPPSDRARVVREADGFVLTVPPRLSWAFAFSAAVGIGIGVVMLVAPEWPAGMRSMVMRVVRGVIGIGLIYLVVDRFSGRRGWAVLSLRSGTLILTSPRLFRTAERQYALRDYADAITDSRESSGCLALVGAGGVEEVLLEGTVYRSADLRFAASVLRDAIKRLDPDYMRKQAELERALGAVRDGEGLGN